MPFSILRADNEWRFDPVDEAWSLLALNRRALPPFAPTRDAGEESLRGASECAFCGVPPAPDAVAPLEDPRDLLRQPPYGGRALDQLQRDDQRWVTIPSPTPLCFVEHEAPPATPFTSTGALGAHELLVPLGSHCHDAHLGTLSPAIAGGILTLLSRRASDLREDARLQSVSLSWLPSASGRLPHHHAALLAKPFPGKQSRSAALCPLCEDLKSAQANGRVLWEHDGFVAYAPFAPRHNLHVRIAAAQHGGVGTFAALERLEDAHVADGLAEGLVQVARGFSRWAHGGGIALAMPSLPLSREAAGAHVYFEVFAPFDTDQALGESLGARIVTLPPDVWLADLRRG